MSTQFHCSPKEHKAALALADRQGKHPRRSDKRDRQKKRFVDALTSHGTVFHAAQAAGVSRNTVYRWRQEDSEFAEAWSEAHENAVDAVENVVYHRLLGRDSIAAIFYRKAQRPKFRNRLNINVEQVQGEIEEMMERFSEHPGFPNPLNRMTLGKPLKQHWTD